MSATNRAAVNDSYQDAALTQIAGVDVSRLTRVECAALLAQTKSLEGRLLARLLLTPDNGAARPTTESSGDKLLTVEQTALALGVSRQWVYRNARKCGLAVELGKGTLRYSHAAIQRYIERSAVTVPSTRRARSHPWD
jgi:predicted DNA-binding transcriptional regulator AlpA